MQDEIGVRVGELGDDDLLVRLKRCLAEERRVTARLLEHFAEVDARGLYRDQGFSSMFEYALHGLHMSESEAGLRITVSRLVREFPEALQMLGRGEIHLTALRLLAPRLTKENLHLLQEARHMSKFQVQALIARYFPQVDVSDSIRRLSVPPGAIVSGLQASQARLVPAAQLGAAAVSGGTASQPLSASVAAAALPRVAVLGGDRGSRARGGSASVPLSEGRFKVQFTAGQGLHDKLRQAQELMRHAAPNADLAVVLERAVDLLIAERRKQLFGKVAKPRRGLLGKATGRSRYVARAIRREVVERVQEQCTFVAQDGRRCTARGGLELDHRVPHGRGGTATADNLRVLCRSHNLLMAERAYGRAFVRERIENAKQGRIGDLGNPMALYEDAQTPRCEVQPLVRIAQDFAAERSNRSVPDRVDV